MRVNFSFVVTIFVALLFVSGTTGCRSTGGPWYNPTSYAFVNPFDKDSPSKSNVAPPFDSLANEKPSLASQPNIGPPPGGYTGGTSLAGRPVPTAGISQSPDSLGQQTQMAPQGPPNLYGGYSFPEPSQYPPSYMDNAFAGHGAAPMPQQAAAQGNPYLYPMDAVQQAANNSAPQIYHQTTLQQPMGAQVGWEQPGHFGAMPQQHDPLGAMQQPGMVPMTGFGHDPMAPVPQPQQGHIPHPGEGATVVFPTHHQQQPVHQPPIWGN